ncbi:L,D-transpeptidase family protein [bacterium]|nr:L,D-transpeptidase family protein [bacterium]
MRRMDPLKQIAIVFVVFVALGAVVVVYGLKRGTTPAEQRPGADQQMALARKFLQQDQPDKALAVIDELRGEDGTAKLGQDAQLVNIMALAETGRQDEVVVAAEQYLDEFPDAPSRTTVELHRLSAEVATAGLSKPGLLKTVEDFIDEHPDHPGTGQLKLALAEQQLALGDNAAARRRLTRLVSTDGLSPDVERRVRQHLGEMNLKSLMRGQSGTGQDAIYTVERGDAIYDIARAHDLTPELLMEANNIDDPRKLRVGQTLVIPSVDFSLVCDIAENEMTLYNHGEFVKSYPVRTGRVAGTTPTGDYKILNKKENPVWRPGDGRVYTAGDPNNELGTRWMAFEGDILGIHGTIHPETVGEYASNGCIGLAKEDVEELFDLLTIGTPLRITGQQDLTRHKVIQAGEIPPPQQDRKIASR